MRDQCVHGERRQRLRDLYIYLVQVPDSVVLCPFRPCFASVRAADPNSFCPLAHSCPANVSWHISDSLLPLVPNLSNGMLEWQDLFSSCIELGPSFAQLNSKPNRLQLGAGSEKRCEERRRTRGGAGMRALRLLCMIAPSHPPDATCSNASDTTSSLLPQSLARKCLQAVRPRLCRRKFLRCTMCNICRWGCAFARA